MLLENSNQPNHKTNLALILKAFRNEEVVVTVAKRRKKAFRRFIEANLPPKCRYFLRVSYGKGLINEGHYNTKTDLLLAYEAFTEQTLVHDITR